MNPCFLYLWWHDSCTLVVNDKICHCRKLISLKCILPSILQAYHRKLPNGKENVCMCVSKEKSLYAIGSQSHVTILDPRSKKSLAVIPSKFRGAGKSCSWNVKSGTDASLCTALTTEWPTAFPDLDFRKWTDPDVAVPVSGSLVNSVGRVFVQ